MKRIVTAALFLALQYGGGRRAGRADAAHPLRLRPQRGFQPGPRGPLFRRGGQQGFRRQDESPRHRRRGARPRHADAECSHGRRAGDDGRLDRHPRRHRQGIRHLWDTPFLFNNEKEADAVLDSPVGQKLLDMLQAKNLVGLVYWENGFRNLTNSRHQVKSAEDMQGIKVRVMQNPIVARHLQGGRLERRPDGLLRTLHRARDQGGRRPGEPLHDDPVLEVLRGSEVPDRHQPHVLARGSSSCRSSGGTSSLPTRRRS